MLNSVIDAIGNTPLIRLKRASEETGCEILGKAEFMNPGQSVKDRAGLFIIRDAEAKGLLRPGGVIVEGTAGNTGIGLTLVAKALGYRTVIVIPDTPEPGEEGHATSDRRRTDRSSGGALQEPQQLRETIGAAGRAIGQERSERRDLGQPVRQRCQPRRPYAHDGEEIWRQTDGKVDGFVSAVGTGGTLAGVALGLKAKNPDVKVGLADPLGAALYSFYTEGVLKADGSSITEGIGQGRITANLEGFTPDFSWQVTDEDALPIVFDLVEEEGLCLGGSTGINIAGAMRLARELGPGHTIVTILADFGTRYQSKLFNPEFLRSKNLPVPGWLDRTPEIAVPYEKVA